jgi:hypothetical protein
MKESKKETLIILGFGFGFYSFLTLCILEFGKVFGIGVNEGYILSTAILFSGCAVIPLMLYMFKKKKFGK